MAICPLCGSERVVPMSFPQDEATSEVEEQPVLKCAVCGHRLFDAEASAADQASGSGHSDRPTTRMPDR